MQPVDINNLQVGIKYNIPEYVFNPIIFIADKRKYGFFVKDEWCTKDYFVFLDREGDETAFNTNDLQGITLHIEPPKEPKLLKHRECYFVYNPSKDSRLDHLDLGLDLYCYSMPFKTIEEAKKKLAGDFLKIAKVTVELVEE